MNLRDSLQRIYDERGDLTAPLVVDAARDPDSDLHAQFEWDDSVAGERYRLTQARKLIGSVRIVYRPAPDKPASSIRAWQYVRDESPSFRPTEEVVADPILTQIVLMDMKREWKALHARYGHFVEFAQMVRTDLGETA